MAPAAAMPLINMRREISSWDIFMVFPLVIMFFAGRKTIDGLALSRQYSCIYNISLEGRQRLPKDNRGQGWMFKTGNRGRLMAALVSLAWAGLALTGCDSRPAYNHSGGIVDGWPVWGHGAAGQRHSANTQITPGNVKDLK